MATGKAYVKGRQGTSTSGARVSVYSPQYSQTNEGNDAPDRGTRSYEEAKEAGFAQETEKAAILPFNPYVEQEKVITVEEQKEAAKIKEERKNSKIATNTPLLDKNSNEIKQMEFGKGNSHIRGIIGKNTSVSDKQREAAYKYKQKTGKNLSMSSGLKQKISETSRSYLSSTSVQKAEQLKHYASLPITHSTNDLQRKRIIEARNFIIKASPESERTNIYLSFKKFDNEIEQYKKETGFSDSKIIQIMNSPSESGFGENKVKFDTKYKDGEKPQTQPFKTVDQINAEEKAKEDAYIKEELKKFAGDNKLKQIIAKGYEMTYDKSTLELAKSTAAGAVVGGSRAGAPGAVGGGLLGGTLYITEDDLNSMIPDVDVSGSAAKIRDKNINPETTKKIQDKINSNIVTSTTAGWLRNKVDNAGKNPATSARGLIDAVAEIEVLSYGLGVTTKVSGAGIRKIGSVGMKYTPKLSKIAPESSPFIKKSFTKIDDVNYALATSTERLGETVLAPTGVFLGGGYLSVKPIVDTYKTDKVTAIEQGLDLVTTLPFGGKAFGKGSKHASKAMDYTKTVGRKEIDINKIADPDVISGKEQEAYFKKGSTIDDVISSAQVLDNLGNPTGKHAMWNAADVPMETWTKDGNVRSDARPPKYPNKDTSGTYGSPEQYGAQLHFLRMGDETYTTSDVIGSLKDLNKGLNDLFKELMKKNKGESQKYKKTKPEWYNQPAKMPGDKSNIVGSKYLMNKNGVPAPKETANKLVDAINGVTDVLVTVFGEADARDPTLSHIEIEKPSRFNEDAIELANKNPNIHWNKDTKGLGEGLKLAQAEMLDEKNIGKTMVTLVTEKKIPINEIAEAELQLTPNTAIIKKQEIKEGFVWYKNRLIKIKEYNATKSPDAKPEIIKAEALKEIEEIQNKSGILERITKGATKELKGYEAKKKGIYYKIPSKSPKVLYKYKPKETKQPQTKDKYSTDKLKYPQSKSKYPSSKSKYPNIKSKYPSSKSKYPSSKSKYPTTKTSYPESKSSYPESKTRYPTTKSGYSKSKSGYPESKIRYPDSEIIPPLRLKKKKSNKSTGGKKLRTDKMHRIHKNEIGSLESIFGSSSKKTTKRKPTTKKSAKKRKSSR